MMDNNTRLQYLAAMGIDVWLPRESSVQAESGELSVAAEAYVEPQSLSQQEPQVSASAAETWQLLNKQIQQCRQCELCQNRQQAVPGAGAQQADTFWVTEAPGEQDEQQAMPFADKSSALVTEILRAMQLSREQVFMTHIVKCRPPADREPKKEEMDACNALLQKQIALVQPKLIMAVGRVAAQQLLQSKQTISELRANTHQYLGIPLVVIYHPAYLLRALTEKPKAWQDIQRALTLLQP